MGTETQQAPAAAPPAIPAKPAVPAKRKEVPQYRLTGPCYVNEIYYSQAQIDNTADPGVLIMFKGIPNDNMTPVNEAAREMKAQGCPPAKVHPLDRYVQAPVAPIS